MAEHQYEPLAPVRRLSDVGRTMAAGPWPEEMNMFEPNVTGLMFFDRAPSRQVLMKAFEKQLWPCHRFNSCIEEGEWVQRHEKMDGAYHFVEQQVRNEEEIERLALREQLTSLNTDFPRWRVFILRTNGQGKEAMLFNCHHALGDGLGLLFAMSPLLGVEGGNPLSSVPLPPAMLPPSVRKAKEGAKPKAASGGGGMCSLCSACCYFLKGAMSPLVLKHDSELSINAALEDRTPNLPYNGNRVYARFPRVPMSAVKAVRSKHDCSVNDVLMAALTGAMRRYAIEIHGNELLQSGEEKVECKSQVMIALPRDIDESDLTSALCNKILFASAPLPIDEPTADERMAKTIEAFGNMKSKAYIAGAVGLQNFLSGIAPRAVLEKAASEIWSKHTMQVTNVPAPSVPMRFPAEGGELVKEVSLVVCNVMPQVSIISYDNFIYASIVADPALYPDTAAFGRMWVDEFKALA